MEKLDKNQKTIVVGVRMPSRQNWILEKIVRELKSENFEITKSELVRFMIQKNSDTIKADFKEYLKSQVCEK